MSKKFDVAIIDLGVGNLFSVKQACHEVGLNAKIVNSKEDLQSAKGIIIPGVGAFKSAMDNLDQMGIRSVLIDEIKKGKPIFGICLGMQILFSKSHEHGAQEGLGVIDGEVLPFPKKDNEGKKVAVPLISWRKIQISNPKEKNNSVYSKFNKEEYMYFVHSYYCQPSNKKITAAASTYADIEYCASIEFENIFATQFHPEKCGKKGLEIYREWANSFLKERV